MIKKTIGIAAMVLVLVGCAAPAPEKEEPSFEQKYDECVSRVTELYKKEYGLAKYYDYQEIVDKAVTEKCIERVLEQ